MKLPSVRPVETLSSEDARRQSVPPNDILPQEAFHKMITLERKRTERSRKPFLLMLLDTGSEPTLMTSAGASRANLPASNKVFPKKVYGLGKTEVEWGRISEVTLGIAGYGARFRDLAVKEDDSAFEDGVIGTSLLEHFSVEIDFSRMLLTLHERT